MVAEAQEKKPHPGELKQEQREAQRQDRTAARFERSYRTKLRAYIEDHLQS